MSMIRVLTKPDGMYLQILTEMDYELLLSELEELGIDLPVETLLDIIQCSPGEVMLPPDALPGKNSEQAQSVDSKNLLTVEVSPDAMKVMLTVAREVNCSFTAEDLKHRLYEEGIRFGVDDEALKQACLHLGKPFRAALGLAPQPGQDAAISYHYHLPDKKPVLMEDGAVDYYELGQIIPVKAGDTIATRTPATPGIPGYNVYGEVLAARDGSSASFNTGKGIIIAEDSAIAEFDGALTWNNNRVSITKMYTISGDIDFSTGNIDFQGKVLITGSVRDGFKVEADDDIDIRGGIDDAQVISRKGSIYVQKGVIGRGKAFLSAQKNIEARFIQEALVKAGQNIVVNEYIVRCNIQAGDSVLIQGRKGRIMGTNIISAGTKIKAARIQNARELDLRVEGFERKRMIEQVKELTLTIDAMDQRLIKTATEIRNLQTRGTQPRSLEGLKQLLPLYIRMMEEMDSLTEQRNLLVNMLKTTRGEGMIEIGAGVEQGMYFTIKKEAIKFDRAAGRISMYYDPDMKKVVLY